MKIICTTTFLHGRDRFEKGDQRTVPDEDGAYFVANGWATAEGAEAAAQAAGEATLDIQNSFVGLGDSNG